MRDAIYAFLLLLISYIGLGSVLVSSQQFVPESQLIPEQILISSTMVIAYSVVFALFLCAKNLSFAALGIVSVGALRNSFSDKLFITLAGVIIGYVWIINAWPYIFSEFTIVHPPLTMNFYTLLSVTFSVAFIPICEELFWRGIVTSAIYNFVGRSGFAIFVSGSLFAAMHFWENSAGIVGVLLRLPISIILTFLYLRTREIYTPIIAHVLCNLTAFSVLLIY
ncbi:MAG: CPBP family intramembrane metalloprotease [Candidatus Sungbacteria bacterium]|nr:CPBP family intramembrane metalloprotease [Candidatus Sungbacteria bacterium]